MIVLGDPQMRDDHDHDIFKTDALPDIKATVKAAKDAGEEVSVLVLGDMCFNNPETFPRYANYWLGLNTPMYHVPGNHDKHIVADVSEQAPEYKATFGPLYYSLCMARQRAVGMDHERSRPCGSRIDSRGMCPSAHDVDCYRPPGECTPARKAE